MHEKRYSHGVQRLRDPGRVARLEVPRVVDLALAGLANPGAVVDIGVGSALFAEEFAARGLAVSGVDANPEMLPAAREYVPQGDFHLGTAEKLPFDDAAFDLAVMGLVFHETDQPLEALRETRRVARQRAALLEWPYLENPFGPPLAHRISPEQIRAWALQAGYKQVESLQLQNLVLYRLC